MKDQLFALAGQDGLFLKSIPGLEIFENVNKDEFAKVVAEFKFEDVFEIIEPLQGVFCTLDDLAPYRFKGSCTIDRMYEGIAFLEKTYGAKIDIAVKAKVSRNFFESYYPVRNGGLRNNAVVLGL